MNNIVFNQRNITQCNRVNNGFQNSIYSAGANDNQQENYNSNHNNNNSNYNIINNGSNNSNYYSNSNNSNYNQNFNFNFNSHFGNDINNMINNLINQSLQYNQMQRGNIYEVDLNESDNSHEEEKNQEVIEQYSEEDIIKIKENLINNFNKDYYKDYCKTKKKKVNDNCAICLEKYKGNDVIVEFSCECHIFHEKCLYEWLQKSEICPLCKHNLMEEIQK